jgi:CheY-like chemotaxis protein
MNRKLMQTLLDSLGCTVDCVASGAAALEAIARSRPDLILLDLMMPVMDGFEVIRHLKRMPEAREIPVVLVTALDNSGVRARLANASAAAIIGKPVDRWELQACIERLLGGGRND